MEYVNNALKDLTIIQLISNVFLFVAPINIMILAQINVYAKTDYL